MVASATPTMNGAIDFRNDASGHSRLTDIAAIHSVSAASHDTGTLDTAQVLEGLARGGHLANVLLYPPQLSDRSNQIRYPGQQHQELRSPLTRPPSGKGD